MIPSPGEPGHLAICGASATGKTALALALAQRLGDVELVSVDSMSVYRHMDIGTAKPSPAERAAARWHMLDLVDPSEEFSVSRFQAAAREAIAGIEARGHRAVLVGGTGLYHRAVVDRLEIPGRWPEVAAELEAAVDGGGTGPLHARLAALDPLAASRIEPGNRRRLVRALEVSIGSGRPFSSFGGGLQDYPPTPFGLIGLDLDRLELRRRLEARLTAQFEAGFLEEVEALAAHPKGISRTARQALGYRELLRHLEEGWPLAEARAETLSRTRIFTRRQEAWFRRDPRLTWLPADGPGLVEALVALAAGEGDGGRSRGAVGGESLPRAGPTSTAADERRLGPSAGVAGSTSAGRATRHVPILRLTLEKLHGAGNDFLVLVDRDQLWPVDAELARALCDRHAGVGADGIIRGLAPRDGGDLRMELRNADGSKAETSGNGLRCLVLAALRAGVVTNGEVVVETAAGRRRLTAVVGPDGETEVSVEMGTVKLDPDEAAITGLEAALGGGRLIAARRADVGNPHLVLAVDSLKGLDVAAIGRPLDEAEPGGLNVELIAPGSDGALDLAVWERGAGLTLACGSGSCAAAAAGRLWGLCGSEVTVRNPGGPLSVRLSGEDPLALVAELGGPTRHVATVTVEVGSLEGKVLA